MKKALIGFCAFLLVAVSVSVAQTVVTNRGEVIEITTYDDMLAATQDTNIVTLASGPWVTLLANDTALTATDAQDYIPDGPGQLLISPVSATATGSVYISTGFTTNDWELLY